MKKKLLIMIVLAVMLVTGTMASSAAAIAVANAGMETVNSEGKPESWLEGAWTKTGATVFSADSETFKEGNSSAKVYNVTNNDARFEQRINVKAQTIYRISAYVKTENVIPQQEEGGANISILDTWVKSEYLSGSNDWTKLELYGKTDKGMTEFILCLRLGFYSAEASGIAYFDSVEVEELSAAPAGVTVQDIKLFEQNVGTTSGNAEWDRRVEGDKFVKWVTAIFVVLLFMMYYFGVYSKKTLNDLENAGKAKKSYKGLLLLIIGGLVLRYWAMVATPFFESDFYGCFKPWAERVFEVGPGSFYVTAGSPRCDYPPLYILVLYFVGGLNSLLGTIQSASPGLLSAEAVSTISDALFILPAVIADVIAAVMIYKVADKKLGSRMAMLLSAAYYLNPAIWFNSASWGQVDSLSALAIVAMIYCLIEKKQLGAFIAFVLGMLTKPQVFIVSPILFFGVANDFIKAYKGEGESLKKFVLNFLKNLGISLAIGVAVILLFMFDFKTFSFTQGPLWIFDLYSNTLGQYNMLSLNALNIYSLFGGNSVDIYASGGIPNKLFGFIPYTAFMFIGLLICVLPLFYFNFKKGKNKNLFLLASFILTATFMLLPKMHERYLFPAIITVLFAFIYLRDKRLLAIFSMMSVGSFINIGLTLYRYWIVDNNTYKLASETITVDQPVGYVISGFNLIWFVFFAYVVYDICIKEHIKDFASTIKGRLDAWVAAPKQRLRDKNEEGGAKLNLKRADVIIILAVTVLYGIFSFIGLGTTSFPENYWSPSYNHEYVIGDLGQTTDNAQYLYYAGAIGKGSFTVEVSADKETWTLCRPVDSGNRDEQGNVNYDYGHMFKWHAVNVAGNSMRYVRITSKSVGFNILEIGIVDKNMEVMPLTLDSFKGGSEQYPAANLFDEQGTVPDRPSYYNSMYFDEIYHARTGYEFVNGLETYETTHPQLGKVFMAWSIEAFGMNPFGWRFAGNVFGIMMLPLVYLFAKLVFKKTWIAALAMGMMTFDGMHFVQTRIATIDVFGVFFIILMYFFMYKYYTMNFYKDKLSKTFIPLGLCGLAFGLGAASKWICLYAALGLAILLFYTLYKRFDEYIYAKKHIDETSGEEREQYQHVLDTFGKYTAYTLLFCVGFFIIIPAVIYVASYAYFVPHNQHLGYLEAVLENQKYMLNYHSGLSADTHPYRSSWYTWPVVARPTWYYNAPLLPSGSAGTIAAFGSPLVWIGALVGTVAACVQGVIDRKKIDADPLNATEPIYNNRDLVFLLIGLASQFVPWIFVPRSTFIYHYFASVPFIIMLTALVFARFYRRDRKRAKTFIIWSLAAMAIVFAIYYPAWSGVVIPEWYRQLLRFPPSWYF